MTIADKLAYLFGGKSHYRTNLFVKILTEFKPRTVFCVGFSPYLSEAGRSLNIQIVEVFHTAGYTEVPVYLNDFRNDQLPTDIIVYDETSQKTFANFRGGVMESL
jgi:hypothetical protein